MLSLDISSMNTGVHTPSYRKLLHLITSEMPLATEVMVHLIGLVMVALAIHLSAMVMLQWDTDMDQWLGLTVPELVATWIELVVV